MLCSKLSLCRNNRSLPWLLQAQWYILHPHVGNCTFCKTTFLPV